MSRERSVQKSRQSKKNVVKRRLEVVEKTQSEGLDKVISEIFRIDGNIMIIAEGLETLDTNIAAMKALCVRKELFTDDEFSEVVAELNEIRMRVAAEKRKLAQAKGEAVPEQVDEMGRPDKELLAMHQAAVNAGDDTAEAPPGAFVFGG